MQTAPLNGAVLATNVERAALRGPFYLRRGP